MKITHHGHACLLVEIDDVRVLIDPGTFSAGHTGLTDIDAIMITHQHFDHFDTPVVAELLAANPAAPLVIERGTADALPDTIPADRLQVVAPGDDFDVRGLNIDVVGGTHATIHPDIPLIPNVGYYFRDAGLLHPGDEFNPPVVEVEVLALPISGPWQKLSDAVDYLRAVNPTVAFPIHEAVTSRPTLFHNYLENLKPSSTTFQVFEAGVATEVAS
ncbi:hypothetical protein ACG83_30805 [Frankia sp. R43]|uniref:MBL fold metallo-hydrolase n=1 Tax=Frankia sp. R43 TaxID=269536 RepID=UPI0006CA5374|nr:MBL fold metallo-hydrolase [Frankia sp. R43]KPM51968.1 hypothetical protein ACG83_30805 [Frankia sp. R43]